MSKTVAAMAAAFVLPAAPLAAQPIPAAAAASSASAPANPRAIELFERDWLLKDWALRLHDRNGDVLLSAQEAATAAAAFKDIADGDNDGRVTPTEFRQAREFILARY